MIKKLANKGRTNSMLEFALEIGQKYQAQKISFVRKGLQRQFDNIKRKTVLKSDVLINGNIKHGFPGKRYEEDDKENVKKNVLTEKPKLIDFVNEKGTILKFPKFDEKKVKFTKSRILPKIKVMKVDNDVLTDAEQVDDAFSMMKDHLNDTIKLIKKNADYLKKNLSKPIKFRKRSS
jgi:hypothetical protein